MSDKQKRPFQFSVRGLMLMTAVVAVGCSIGCLKTAKWEDGLFAFAAAWIVIGLVVQIVDLWAAFRQATGLSPDQRAGWWFAILSRGALAALLVGHFVLLELLVTGQLKLAGADETGMLGPLGHETTRDAILAMSLLLVLAGFDGGKSRAAPRHWTVAVNFITSLGIVILVYHLLIERFVVQELVHIACAGIVQGLPHGDPAYVRIYSEARAWSFLGYAVLASILILLDLFFLRQLITHWNCASRCFTSATSRKPPPPKVTAFPRWLQNRPKKRARLP